MLNKVLIIGNLTRDIELRYLPSGSAVAKSAIAVSRKWKDKNSGETKEETMFIDFSAFGRTAEIANQYLSKGSKVMLESRLVLEQWVDQSGQKRSKHVLSVENLEMLGDNGSAPQGHSGAQDAYDEEIPL
jgi:single-strand DNA-binding protein